MTVEIESVDHQAIMMGLADLSLARPGWEDFLREIAGKFRGVAMFNEFRRLHADLIKPHGDITRPPQT